MILLREIKKTTINNIVKAIEQKIRARSYQVKQRWLKLKVKKFLALILTFVEVIGKKLVEGLFAPSPHPDLGYKRFVMKAK